MESKQRTLLQDAWLTHDLLKAMLADPRFPKRYHNVLIERLNKNEQAIAKATGKEAI